MTPDTRPAPALGDLWDALPAPTRRLMADTGAARAPEIFTGVAAALPGPWAPVRPVLLSRSAMTGHAGVLRHIARLALEACRRRATTAEELRTALGHPADRYRLFDPHTPIDDSWLASSRMDILIEGGTPRIIEFNIDSAIGGARQTDELSERFFHRYGELGLLRTLGLGRPASALTARAESMRAALGPDAAGGLAFPFFSGGQLPPHKQPDAFRAFLEGFAAAARKTGLDARTCGLDELGAGPDGRLRLPDGWAVDGVFRLFFSEEVDHHPGYDVLAKAVSEGKVRLYTPESTRLLSDKTVLAWLWDDLGLLPAADAELVRRHVPLTVQVDGARGEETLAAALARPADWVLKPSDGHGGAAVVLGADTPDGAWRELLSHAAGKPGLLLQAAVSADPLTMEFVHTGTGERTTAAVPLVLGPFLFDLHQDSTAAPAVMARHAGPGGGAVVNVQQGAVLSCALLCEPPDGEG